MLPPCIVCCDKCTFVPIFRCEQLRTEATKFFWNASADLPEILCDSKARSHKFISGGPWRLLDNILEFASGSSLGLWLGAAGVSLYGKLELTPLSNPGYPGPQAVTKTYFVDPFPSEMSYTLKAEYAEALAELKCVLFAQFGGNKFVTSSWTPVGGGNIYSWHGYSGRTYEVPIVTPLVSYLREPAAGAPTPVVFSTPTVGGVTNNWWNVLPGGIAPDGALYPYYAPFVAPPRNGLEEPLAAWQQRIEVARRDWAKYKPTKSYQVKSLISLNGTERLVMPPAADKWLASMRLNTLSAPAEGGRLVTAFCHAKQPPDAKAGVSVRGGVIHGAGKRAATGADPDYTHVPIAGIGGTAACFFKIYRDGQLIGEVTKEKDSPDYAIGNQLTPYTTEEGSYFIVGDFDGSWLLDFGKTDAEKGRAPQPLRSFWSFVVDKTPPARAWYQCRDVFVDEFFPDAVPAAGRLNEPRWGTGYEADKLEPFPVFSFGGSYSVNGGPITPEWWPLSKGEHELRAAQVKDRALNETVAANTLPDIVLAVRERSLDNEEIELPEGYTGPAPRFDPLLWEGVANTDGMIHENPLTEIDLVFDKSVVILDESMSQAATTPADEEEYLLEALEVKGKDVSTGADKEAEVESIRRLSDRRFRLKLSDGDQTTYNTQWAISFKPVHGAEGSEKSRVSVTKPVTNDGPLTYGQCQPCLLGCRFMWCIVQDPAVGRELIDTSRYEFTTTSASSVTQFIPTPTEEEEGDGDGEAPPTEVITATAGVNVEPALGSFHSEPDPPTFVPGVPSSLDAAVSVPFSYFGFPTTINPSPAMTLPACASPSAPQRHSSMIFGPEITTLTISRNKSGSIPVGVYRPWYGIPSELFPSTTTHTATLEGQAAEQNTWCHVSHPGTKVAMRPTYSNPPSSVFLDRDGNPTNPPYASGYDGEATLTFYQSHITASRSFTCYPGLGTTTTGELVLQWSSRYMTYGYDEHFEEAVAVSGYRWTYTGNGHAPISVTGQKPTRQTIPPPGELPEQGEQFVIYDAAPASFAGGATATFYNGNWYYSDGPDSPMPESSYFVVGLTPQTPVPPPIVIGIAQGNPIFASNGVSAPGGTSIGKNEYYMQFFGTSTFIFNKAEEQRLVSGQPVTLTRSVITYGLGNAAGCWMGTTPPKTGDANELTVTITAS